jgi:hypothetical protein
MRWHACVGLARGRMQRRDRAWAGGWRNDVPTEVHLNMSADHQDVEWLGRGGQESLGRRSVKPSGCAHDADIYRTVRLLTKGNELSGTKSIEAEF